MSKVRRRKIASLAAKALKWAGIPCVVIGLSASAWSDAQTPLRTSRADASPRAPYAGYVTPLTLSFPELAPCAPKRPLVQTKARPRPVHVRRKVRRPSVLKRATFKPHRRPLPATLAELAHPVRCEVVRSSTLYQPVGLVTPARPMEGATPYPPVLGLSPTPIIALDQSASPGGPSLFPDIPTIIGGGSRNTKTGSTGPGGSTGGTANPPGGTGSTSGGGGPSPVTPPPPGGATPVSAAPEPAEWTLYTLGVGLLGVVLRRRRTQAA